MANKKDTEWFKNKIKNKYGNKVILLSEYNGSLNKVKIKTYCEKHGWNEKELNAKNIFATSFTLCEKCSYENRNMDNNKKSKEELYEEFKKIIENKNGKLITDKWTRSKSTYKIECDKGHIFETTADSIMNKKQWCPYCYGRRGDFESRCIDIIKNNDGELLSNYVNAETHLKVKCNKDNFVWYITPANLNKGRWCPVCNMNISERVPYDYMVKLGLNVVPQYKFYNLRSKTNTELKFDFGIIDDNNNIICLIEIDDDEHRYNHTTERRIEAINRDRMKDKYCEDNNINLIRIPYYKYKKEFHDYDLYMKYIEETLGSELNKYVYK